MVGGFGLVAEVRGGHEQVFQGAAQANPQLPVVGVHDRDAARQVGVQPDAVGLPPELPRLGVVTRRRERGQAHQLAQVGAGFWGWPAGLVGGGFVVAGVAADQRRNQGQRGGGSASLKKIAAGGHQGEGREPGYCSGQGYGPGPCGHMTKISKLPDSPHRIDFIRI